MPGVPSGAVTTWGMPSSGSWFAPSALARYTACTSTTNTTDASSSSPTDEKSRPDSSTVEVTARRWPACAHTSAAASEPTGASSAEDSPARYRTPGVPSNLVASSCSPVAASRMAASKSTVMPVVATMPVALDEHRALGGRRHDRRREVDLRLLPHVARRRHELGCVTRGVERDARVDVGRRTRGASHQGGGEHRRERGGAEKRGNAAHGFFFRYGPDGPRAGVRRGCTKRVESTVPARTVRTRATVRRPSCDPRAAARRAPRGAVACRSCRASPRAPGVHSSTSSSS